ncbi:hypothetical protein WN51_02611 [Melipona quadrifasciata]|uniref:Uncharacterized protein n=1 Tax=Melipona quadrifasciata TaxID=166423 RepID=A0A0M8ZT26_9HYME|nr:hypothetical protein WN51_02611 [Melipona quadrifasciata]
MLTVFDGCESRDPEASFQLRISWNFSEESSSTNETSELARANEKAHALSTGVEENRIPSCFCPNESPRTQPNFVKLSQISIQVGCTGKPVQPTPNKILPRLKVLTMTFERFVTSLTRLRRAEYGTPDETNMVAIVQANRVHSDVDGKSVSWKLELNPESDDYRCNQSGCNRNANRHRVRVTTRKKRKNGGSVLYIMHLNCNLAVDFEDNVAAIEKPFQDLLVLLVKASVLESFAKSQSPKDFVPSAYSAKLFTKAFYLTAARPALPLAKPRNSLKQAQLESPAAPSHRGTAKRN